MPLARLFHETVRTTAFALVGFAILRWLSGKANIPGLRAALGAAGA